MSAPALQQFEYLPEMTLRVLQRDGEPWFVAKDVCDVLGFDTAKHGTGAFLSHMDVEEVASVNLNTLDTTGGKLRGNPTFKIISESGLYLLVLKSRKAEAKAFQKWVTGEVLGGHYR